MAGARWPCHHGASSGDEEDPTATPAPAPQRAAWLLTRSRDNRVLTGVAGGLGERLGVDPILVRMAFAVLAIAGGSGVVLYLVAWALSAEPDGAAPAAARRRPSGRQALALGCIVLGTLLLLRDAGLWFGDRVVWPVALAAAGSALLWARSDDRDRARWTRAGARIPGNPVEMLFTGRASLARIVVGGLLVAAGMGLVLAGSDALAAAGSVLVAMAVTAAGLGMILGPWTYRLARQVGEERRGRIRSEARAEMAAHLHDSVLHTLALIQRADAPPEVLSLARRQERELRAWLYEPGSGQPEGRLRPAVEALAARVEQHHAVPVEVVVVGDAPLDERARAVVDACQEAAVNAARHSGAPLVAVYVEVERDQLTGYVRDQGKGFDPAQVPPDRHGIADSIRGRMQRYGGTATIVSAPGEGTEVQLRMPRAT